MFVGSKRGSSGGRKVLVVLGLWTLRQAGVDDGRLDVFMMTDEEEFVLAGIPFKGAEMALGCLMR